jgi:hypothetical protein
MAMHGVHCYPNCYFSPSGIAGEIQLSGLRLYVTLDRKLGMSSANEISYVSV